MVMKKKGAAKGGVRKMRGGGMAKKGYAKGGMQMKKKGYARGGFLAGPAKPMKGIK